MRDLPAKQKRPLQVFVAALSRNKERDCDDESVLRIGMCCSFLLMATSYYRRAGNRGQNRWLDIGKNYFQQKNTGKILAGITVSVR